MIKSNNKKFRRTQAELLQGFVGFHIKYCMHALERSQENVEMAAEWAISHFDTVSVEHPGIKDGVFT